MATILTDDKHYKGIANTLRDFSPTSQNEAWKPEELPEAIFWELGNAYDVGEMDGWEAGYDAGLDDGETMGWNEAQKEIESIKTKAYNDFWDLLQENGKRVDYQYAFMRLNFNKDSFKPKYDIKPTSAADMFNNCPSLRDGKVAFNLINGKQVVMKEVEEEQGIVFDFSNITNFTRTFSGCLFSELNVIDMRKATATPLAFYGGYISGYGLESSRLKKIEKIISSANTIYNANTFGYDTMLTHIRFEGIIASDINFKDSPLDKASIEDIVSHLSDNTSGKTLTLNFYAVDDVYNPEGIYDWTDEATPPEWLDLIATKPNWNIVF